MAIWNKIRQLFNSDNTNLFEVVMVADKDGNIINSSGASSNINIAAGAVDGYSHINKFGYTGTAVNGTSTVWDYNASGEQPLYSYLTSAAIVTVTSDDGGDVGRTVQVEGLDANYNEISETLTVGGPASSLEFFRVYRARVTSNGDVNNLGNISVTGGGETLAYILAGNGQTLMAVYTVPAGKTAYMFKFHGSSGKVNTEVNFMIFTKPLNETWQIKGMFGAQGGNILDYEYPVPLKIEEKTDIEIEVITDSTSSCGSVFDLILVDN